MGPSDGLSRSEWTAYFARFGVVLHTDAWQTKFRAVHFNYNQQSTLLLKLLQLNMQ